MKLLLVDLSSLFRPIFEMSGKEADQDYASKATVARVHELAQGFDGVAVCCDSRKSWRKELCATYKANRPATEEPLRHQLKMAQEQLEDDGFPVWTADGFEADDVIAAAVAWLGKGRDPGSDVEIVIASSDKDLACLVEGTIGEQQRFAVFVKSLRTGAFMDAPGVVAKFGVAPYQMVDWLCMVGDSSDNIAGIKDIGAKRATALLQKHGSLANIYATIGDSCTKLSLTPSMFTNLKEGTLAAEMARKLITLRADVELPFADIFKPRVAKAAPVELEDDMPTVDGEFIDDTTGEVTPAEPSKTATVVDMPKKKEPPASFEQTSRAMVPVEWSQSLEPANLSQAMNLAKAIFASRQFAAYGTPEAVLLAIMTGRELGISTMAALRSIHIIEGKPTMSAGLIAGLVLRSKTCKQFEIVERTNERATIRVWREGWEKPKDITYSVDDAKRAGRVKAGSGWEKNPADMCVARCQAVGGRLGWPDIFANVYLADELGREEAA